MRRRPGKRDKTSSTCGQVQSFKKDQLSHTSLRQLQAKMEAENQQVQELIQPLLDTQNGFMKEIGCFLSQQDELKLRKRELLHKDWTEHVWFPLQKKLEERVSRCSPLKVRSGPSSYNDDLHYFPPKIKPAYFKDTLDLSQCKTLREKKKKPSLQTGNKCTWRKPQKLSQNHARLDKCALTQASHLPQTSSHHPASTSIKIPRKDEAEGMRLDNIPCHIDASDGRCHQSGCFFSTMGVLPTIKKLQQLK